MPIFDAFSSSWGVELTMEDHTGFQPLGRMSIEDARGLVDAIERAIKQSETELETTWSKTSERTTAR